MLREEKILEVLREQQVSVASLEEGARLVDYWIEQCETLDGRDKTLAVEVGFFYEAAPLTFIVGTQDRVAQSHVTGEVFGCEWKTTKHRTKLWTPEAWFESISNGHQVATYALGLKRGVIVGGSVIETIPLQEGQTMFPEDGSVNILVRAISKSSPPDMWPSAEGQFVNVTKERLEAVKQVYVNEAEAVRARRRTGVGPWQLPGLQCTNQFRSVCPHLSTCRKFESFYTETHLSEVGKGFSPGSKRVVQHLVESGKVTEENFKDVVILSASSLSTLQQCAERWRIESGTGEEEENEYLEVGTVLHAGVGEMYRQQMED